MNLIILTDKMDQVNENISKICKDQKERDKSAQQLIDLEDMGIIHYHYGVAGTQGGLNYFRTIIGIVFLPLWITGYLIFKKKREGWEEKYIKEVKEWVDMKDYNEFIDKLAGDKLT